MVWNFRNSLYLINLCPEYIEYLTKYVFQDILGRAKLSLATYLDLIETSFHCSNILLSNQHAPLSKTHRKWHLGDTSPSRWYHVQCQISIQRHVWRSLPMDLYSNLHFVFSVILISLHITIYPCTVSLLLLYASRHIFPTKLQGCVAKEVKTY